MTESRLPNEDSSAEFSKADEAWVERVRLELGPGERTPAERASFRMRLDERIENRRRPFWQPFMMTTGAALAAALLWFVLPADNRIEDANRNGNALGVAGSPGLLSYAYYETDYLATGEDQVEFLSDEYQAIANAFDVP